MNSIEYPLIRCSFIDYPDIILMELKDKINLDLKATEEMIANRLSFSKNKAHFLVGDFSNVRSVTPAAWRLSQDEKIGLKNILGAAFISSSPVASLLINIFVKSNLKVKVKYFSNKAEAIRWIKEYRTKLFQTKNSEPS